MKYIGINTFVFLMLFALSCTKDTNIVKETNPIQPNQTGSVSFQFVHMFDSVPLQYDSVNYILDNGDKFKVNVLKYYISNIQLVSTNGKVFSENESYHLINGKDSSSLLFTLNNVPIDNYKEIRLIIGVDSARNVSGSQSGALDINNDMFWSWNTGYIMAKMEGASQQSPNPDKSFGFHIGGFKGINNALQHVSFDISAQSLVVNTIATSKVKIKSNIKEWFVNPTTISFANLYNVTSINNDSKTIATNYRDMLSIQSIN